VAARMSGFEVIVVGTSWGGLRALGIVLDALPAGFPTPVVIALHRSPRSSEEALIGALQRHTHLTVTEAADKEDVGTGHVYVAPANYHLLLDDGQFALSTDDLVQFSRPSIDVLFESAADAYGERAIGVILTGANADGAAGLARLRGAGALAIVQEPATAERAEMPAAALERAGADHVVDLDRVGPLLVDLCRANRP
jgi:two-component system chemotaxis response regulator CheB